MALEAGLPILCEALKIVAVPQLRYFTSFRTYERDLQEEVENLKNFLGYFRNTTEEDRNNLRIASKDVSEWQESADMALTRAHGLLSAFGQASKSCCYGTLPDPCVRYQFSMEAEDNIKEIRRLLRRAVNIKRAYFTVPDRVDEPRDEILLESRRLIMRRILDAFDDPRNSVVGVFGMGGVGKSTFLVQVKNKLTDTPPGQEKKFDWVAKADVSEEPDINRIQGEIAVGLGFTDFNEQEKENVSLRAQLLRCRLEKEAAEKRKVLIILDNLWKPLDLKLVGIPCKNGNKVRGCKLLLTSRDRNVLTKDMHCDSSSVFRLTELRKEEAKEIFEAVVKETISDRDFKHSVAEALDKCAGLPQLIVEMANLFRTASPFAFRDALRQIEKSTNEGIDKKINDLVKSSYDHLCGEEEKSFLRLCVVYHVAKPRHENLVRYGVGYVLGSEYESMRSARDRLNTLIETLQASSLSLDSEDADSEDADIFKIHGLVRKFVVWVASRANHHILVLKDKDDLRQDKLNSCRAVCFPDADVVKPPEELNCPELLIFLLFSRNESVLVSDSCFNSMGKLKVINLTGIRLTRSTSPSPFRSLYNLQTLCLDECLLEDVSIIGELKGLQVLSFVNSKIDILPEKIGQLTELRLLDLSNCSELRTIEPDVLGRLTKLEELYMEKSFPRWDPVDLKNPRTNASLTELNNMPNLRTLHLSILNLSVLPNDLNITKLDEYKIQMGDVSHSPRYKVSKTLMIKANPTKANPEGIDLWDPRIQTTLVSTDYLYLHGLNLDRNERKRSLCSLSEEAFPNLRHLCVENSSAVRYLMSSSNSFEMLESFIFEDLSNLEKICEGCINSKFLNLLKEVRVKTCAKMEVLFPFQSAMKLPRLEEISVVNCESMQMIVKVDDGGKVEFPDLRVLELCDLPHMKNFFSTGTAPLSSTSDDHVGTQDAFFYGQQVLIPSLESVTMDKLPNLKNVWSDKSQMGPSNLQSLELVKRKSLSKVISLGSLVKPHELRTLTVKDCDLVQEIFYHDESSARGNCDIQLTTLHLEKLPSLSRIWSKNVCGIMKFRYLKQLTVLGCDSLKFMFFPSMVNSLEQLRTLTVQKCKRMEAIVTKEEEKTSEALTFPKLYSLCFERLERLTCFYHENCSQEVGSQNQVESRITALFGGKVAFPKLEKLEIKDMDNIEMIWDSHVDVDSFPILKSLCVNECSKLVNIGPHSILRRLGKLETLEAKACGSVEAVFELQQLKDGIDAAGFHLKKLELVELPKLKCVWDKELFHQVICQCSHSVSISKCESLTSLVSASIATDLTQLEESDIHECGDVGLTENTSHASHCPEEIFEVRGCNKAEILALQPENEVPLHKEPPVWVKKGNNEEAKEGPSHQRTTYFSEYFELLTSLTVSHCDGLSKLFMPAIVKSLKRLAELKISFCKMLTEVISDEGGEKGGEMAFGSLKHLELDGLTGLKCFSLGGCTLTFPHLENIIVTDCLNMEYFSRGEIEARNLKSVQISRAGTNWKVNGNLNTTIKNIYEKMAMIARVKFIRLSEFPELIEIWHEETDLIKSSWQLESLVVDKCSLFSKAIPSQLMLVLDNMRRLQVRDCESLEEILDLEGLETGRSTLLLPELQQLVLVNLPKLRQLWNKDLQGTISFSSLKCLTLYNCSNLGHAFVPSMAWCFANLERMEIKKCGQMEGVIAEKEGQGSEAEGITFPRLSWMKLECLPNLTSFLSGKNHKLDCPRLEHLIIAHCPKLRSFTWQPLMKDDRGPSSLFTPQVQFRRLESMVISHMDSLSKIWTDSPQETFTFKHLQKVDVQNCKNLEILFPYGVATRLSQLEELRVESCGLEEIVTKGDDTPHSSIAKVIFSKLTYLVLHEMPRLKNFCPNLPTLNWRFLKELRVTHCDKLNMLSFSASMDKWAHMGDHQILSDQEARSSLERDFTNLERLLLVEKDLQMIQDGKFLDKIFAKPKALTLACFHEENAVFPPKFLFERFRSLQSLEFFCNSFEDIFRNEELVDEGKHPVLENLRELKLSKLCNLRRVWKEDHLVLKVLQGIQMFEVSDCPGLTTLCPAKRCFQNLTKLVVKNSSGLVHLVTFSAIINLVHLMDMTIVGCGGMKEVVANDEDGGGEVISLGKLESLRLQNLPSLECFSSTTSHTLELPSLIDIVVEECPGMKIFSKGELSTPNLRLATLFGYFWEAHLEGDLNSAIKKLST